LISPMTLCQLEDDPAVQSSPELAKQMAELCAEADMPEPRKEGLLAKAAGAMTAGLATSAGLQIIPALQKFIHTIIGG